MNLDEFLYAHGVDIPSLLATVGSSVGLLSGDVLLLVGSLVEGLGNSKSDLDLFLITPRTEQSLPPRDEIALLVGRSVVDLRILRLAQVEDLLGRLAEWALQPWEVMHAAKFTKEERVLLHRLLHGKLLPYRDQINPVPRPSKKAVARLNLHVARHISRTIQVDMIGYRESEDYRSLVFAAQELLGHAVDALLAAYELTNPLPKWRSRLLESIPSQWESSLTMRPDGASAGQRIWRLHRAPEHPDRDACLNHASRIATFARPVFVWAERRLVGESTTLSEQLVWPQLERRPTDVTLPYLDFDVDFLLEDGNVTIGRLNAFGDTLSLTPVEGSLTLLFDGATTAREAAAAILRDQSVDTGLSLVNDLISRLTKANLNGN
ncbi:MAG: hypothetical protein WB729_08070 [Candidatus Sulfotelmatobacter sp.]|jgi:hypothetical protein